MASSREEVASHISWEVLLEASQFKEPQLRQAAVLEAAVATRAFQHNADKQSTGHFLARWLYALPSSLLADPGVMEKGASAFPMHLDRPMWYDSHICELSTGNNVLPNEYIYLQIDDISRQSTQEQFKCQNQILKNQPLVWISLWTAHITLRLATMARELTFPIRLQWVTPQRYLLLSSCHGYPVVTYRYNQTTLVLISHIYFPSDFSADFSDLYG